MNKYTVRIKMTLSVSPILKVLASLTKKSVFYKNRKQSKSIRTKNLFPKRKSFSLLQSFNSKKCNSIFATSVIEVGVSLKNLKVCFGFLCRYYKIHWKEQFLFLKQHVGMLFLREIENMTGSFLLKEHF